MRTSATKGALGKAMGHGSGEWLWGGLGIGVATVSASFAAYMVVVGPANVGVPTAANFGVLAHLGPRHMPVDSHATALLQGRSSELPVVAQADAGAAPASTGPARAGEVDFAPTGTVGSGSPVERRPASSSADGGPPTLKSFILRDVFDGKALVESRDTITLVAPGTMLDGAGEVLAIQRRGDAWVVTTSRGLITASAR